VGHPQERKKGDPSFRFVARDDHPDRVVSGATVVRAEVTVDGSLPPDGRAVRYFWVSLKFGGDGEWLVMGESNSYQYLMELMPASRKVSKWWN
jgi:hypothetical protein